MTDHSNPFYPTVTRNQCAVHRACASLKIKNKNSRIIILVESNMPNIYPQYSMKGKEIHKLKAGLNFLNMEFYTSVLVLIKSIKLN